MVQRSGQILSKEDKDMADGVMQVLAAEGVDVHLNASVLGVRDLGHGKEVRIKTKEGEVVPMRAEQILVAMGRDPNLAGLELGGIGVDVDRRGIQVDARMRTSRKHIYEAGDVTGVKAFRSSFDRGTTIPFPTA